jgi:hypothetical protein
MVRAGDMDGERAQRERALGCLIVWARESASAGLLKKRESA